MRLVVRQACAGGVVVAVEVEVAGVAKGVGLVGEAAGDVL